ncbi:MAG: 7-cyano-7-deazaguanine synthase QueC [Planctomycetota bacterium]|nr:7-cyano-7-deazaguanine synthase QueC [Planctomycetota bacterium]
MYRNQPAIILSSGGIDSTTCLAIAKHEQFYPLYSLSFDYGQRHRQELVAAGRIAVVYDVAEHRIIEIDLRQFGGSALTDDIAVPKDRDESAMAGNIPITYVPARNTVFLSYALAFAEVREVRDIFIGVNAIDYSGYPDCRPEFIIAFEKMANLATRMTTTSGSRPFIIHTPLMHLTKGQIIRRGVELGVDYSLTRSCYDPAGDGKACGHCDSCLLRRKGFADAGVADPTRYAI